jgi:RHS repeat-associated protein
VAAVVALIVPALSAEMPPPAYTGQIWSPFPLPAAQSVPGNPIGSGAGAAARKALDAFREPAGTRAKAARAYRPRRVVWPASGSARLQLTQSVPAKRGRLAGQASRVLPGWRHKPGLGVQVRATVGGTVPTEVSVSVASRRVTAAAGVRGVLVSVGSAVPGSAGRVRIRVPYSAFADAYGGGWASRLRLVELPACASATPSRAACRRETVIRSANDPGSRSVSATVRLPAALAGAGRPSRPIMLAAVSGPAGSGGSFTATPLKPSGTWVTQQGSFDYSYPFSVPPALGGSAPSVALSYDSQSIDSETSASNTQAGSIGDGWDYSPGFIERSYQACSQDSAATAATAGDECWGGYNATLSLAGHSTVLVLDDTTQQWQPQSDDGTQVQLIRAPSDGNGVWQGEYWLVITPDGTKYYFGADHLPGGNGSDPATNSAWGEPVYNPGTTDPCYAASSGTSSWCQMGWRWNLDYVVDPAGNLTVYDYAAETNYYKRAGATGGGTLTQYTRGGYLTSISYGWLLPDAIAGALPAERVEFANSDRCLASQSTCDANHNGANWPDVPWDQSCDSTGSCLNVSPTFFTTQMMTGVTTQVRESGSWKTIDSWALSQSFPVVADSNPVIFLNSITRTGLDGLPAAQGVALPAMTFEPAEIDNRVDGLNPPAPAVDRPRIEQITTETGANIQVTYAPPACSRINGTMPTSVDKNNMPCFPAWWTPTGDTAPIQDWFTKSLVSEVTVSDETGVGSPTQVTNYSYLGGAAWHENLSPVASNTYRTWDQFRGYAQIEVTSGTAPDPVTETMFTYMRGMDGDPLSGGGTASVTVQDPNGDTPVTDSNWLAGQALETDTYTGSGGTVDERVIGGLQGQWKFTQTASQSQPGSLPALTAHMEAQTTQETLTKLAGGGTGTDQVTTYYNGQGQVAAIDNNPSGAGVTETCSTTIYASPPAGNSMMVDYAKQTSTVTGSYSAGSCPAKTSANVVSDARYYYDDESATLASLGTLGSLSSPGGLLTGQQRAVTWASGGSESWQAEQVTGYDPYGRVTSQIRPASTSTTGNLTTTSYVPAYTAGTTTELPHETDITNPKGWTSKVTYDQGRKEPLTLTDVNNETTTEQYDPLGRLTSVWMPIDPTSGPATYTYQYSVTGTAPSAVTSSSLREDGSYSEQVQIFDGMLQQRQIQDTPVDNEPGRLVSDTFYDSHGWTVKTNSNYYDSTTAPTTTLFVATDGAVLDQNRDTYDGQGRQLTSQFWSDNAFQWQTASAYPGLNETDVTPPSGGTATSTFTNVLGQTTATWDYTTASPDGTAADADITGYTYDPPGQVATVADDSGNTWTYSYDLLGEKVAATSPGTTGSDGPNGNEGTTTYTYDPAGNLASTTDPLGVTVSYAYDALNRMTAEYDGSVSTGTLLDAWEYDKDKVPSGHAADGQLDQATSYDPAGNAYTESIAGYTTDYQPTGTSITIPVAAGGLAGTYTMANTYSSVTGLLATTAYSADGGLPAETVRYSYDLNGLLNAVGGNSAYLDQTSYTPLGQPERTTFGVFGKQLVQTYGVDPDTNRLIQATTSLQTLAQAADITNYTYDKSGNLTSSSDQQNTGGTQTQCFSYNHLGQLTTAWTDTGGTTSAASPSVPGIGGCANPSPAAANIGGAAPYWESWTDNQLGDRSTQVIHNTAGTTSLNQTQTMAYPAGTTPAQPDAAQTATTTVNSAVTAVTSNSYDADGNTITDLNSGSTPLVSALQTSAGQQLCADDFHTGTTSGTKADLFTCNFGASQIWTVPTATGQIKIQGLCLAVKGNATTTGSLVELDTCSSTAAGQKWKPGATGSLTNPNSGMCLDDPGGSKTLSTQLDVATCNGWPRQDWGSQQISYTPQGRTYQVTTSAGTSTYTYDASGNLLLQADPASTTLYLDGGTEQLTLTGSTVSGLRYYPAPDGTATMLSSSGTISYAVGNPQGTSQESVNASTLAQKRRYYDPYGNPVGTVPGSWPDNRAFLGQPADSASGYDLLGARQYDPVTGAFLSIDPDFQPGDPLAMGGYAYADDNPATNTDPAGTMCVPGASANGNCNDQPTQENGDGGGGGGGYSGGGSSYGGGYTTVGTVVLPASYPHVKEIKKIFNQLYQGGVKQHAWPAGQSTEYKALLLACQSNQSICGSTLMNALYRGGPDGTAMTVKDGRAWQSSGESQAAWLYTHGQQMVLQNSAMVSATVFAGVLANRALGKAAEAATKALYEANGYKVTDQVTIEMASGNRSVTDFVVEDQSGSKSIVEVKVGNATLTTNQAELFYESATGQDVFPVGENARAAGFEPGVGVYLPAVIEHWEGP